MYTAEGRQLQPQLFSCGLAISDLQVMRTIAMDFADPCIFTAVIDTTYYNAALYVCTEFITTALDLALEYIIYTYSTAVQLTRYE